MNLLYSSSACFPTGLKTSLADRLLPLFVVKAPLEKITPTGRLVSNCMRIKEPVLLVRYFNKPALCGWLYNAFTALSHPQLSGLVEHTNSAIKIQLAKFAEALQIAWPKALPLVLLNLRSTPFLTQKPSPLETVTGHPMHLAPAPLIHK